LPFFPQDVWLVFGGTVLLYVVLRFVAGINSGWRKDEDKMNSPMSITLKTGESPADVLAKARRARTQRYIFLFSLFVAGWAIIYYFDRDFALRLVNLAVELIVRLAQVMVQLLQLIIEQLQRFLISRTGEQ
jgi:hypothetical protein